MDNITGFSKEVLLSKLWKSDHNLHIILRNSGSLRSVREHVFTYLDELEEMYFDIHSESRLEHLHVFEKENAKECIRVLKNIIRTESEILTGFSALQLLADLADRDEEAIAKVSNGFLAEFIALFRGINGRSGILHHVHDDLDATGRKAGVIRSRKLDEYAKHLSKGCGRFHSGYDNIMIARRNILRKKILRKLGGKSSDWYDYHWHMDNIIRDVNVLKSLVKLSSAELLGVQHAEKNKIPFEITPYYLSLFNRSGRTDADRAIRSQVLPSVEYTTNVVNNWESKQDLDFMGERSTSPIDCITRRYPNIVILKPYNSCPQICVYCQRNWEITDMRDAKVTRQKVRKAIDWIRKNKAITEVLVTGGDPLTLTNKEVDWIFGSLAKINHIDRIRIGTRTLVTLPFRFDKGLLRILEKYHDLGRREVAVVTHFEHPTELTPESLDAVKQIKERGISVYNQQVFTYFNSRRYETCLLRRLLKRSGIDPYYSFNTKGKEETVDFRVPIAKILQERKEEARLLPGLVRTDEPVFNVPRLGKSHLRAWQDHEPIMILPDGKRMYRFYPWESKLKEARDYIYTDVSIYDYLKRLKKDGENPKDYGSIWYYF